MLISNQVKDYAKRIGISALGIIGRSRFEELPFGPVSNAAILHSPLSILPSARSLIVVGYSIWDPVYNVMVVDRKANGHLEDHQLYSQVSGGMAWELACFLESKGYQSVATRRVCLKRAAVLAGLGAQGKNTVVISPEYGATLRLAAVLTNAELAEDHPYDLNPCAGCNACVEACPTRALKDGELDIHSCLVFAAENPTSDEVTVSVREAEQKLIRRVTSNSYIECSICLDSCPHQQAFIRRMRVNQ